MNSEKTLYERIGGKNAIQALIADFYDSLMKDPELSPFFENTSLERLLSMQTEFFSAALDGPTEYTGTEIYQAHHGKGISRAHFHKYVEHLFKVLQNMKLPESDVEEIIARINLYADDVVGSGAGVGD